MHFKITIVSSEKGAVLPINYSYPLSSAIYRIIARGDAQYAAFLHETGDGIGLKFCFTIQNERACHSQSLTVAFQEVRLTQKFNSIIKIPKI